MNSTVTNILPDGNFIYRLAGTPTDKRIKLSVIFPIISDFFLLKITYLNPLENLMLKK